MRNYFDLRLPYELRIVASLHVALCIPSHSFSSINHTLSLFFYSLKFSISLPIAYTDLYSIAISFVNRFDIIYYVLLMLYYSWL